VSDLIFHHCRDLAHAEFGVARPLRQSRLLAGPSPAGSAGGQGGDDRRDAVWFEAAYAWLAEQQGFWPIFLGVGDGDDARWITGYDQQWRRRTAADAAAGPPPSQVLFSWRAVPEGCVYSDYDYWHIVLNSVAWGEDDRARVEGVGPQVRSQVLKPSYRVSDWLRRARRSPGSVQATAPTLDLRTADAVWCRNRAARAELIGRGFSAGAVEVRRLPVLR
jgi:hypothetical protein